MFSLLVDDFGYDYDYDCDCDCDEVLWKYIIYYHKNVHMSHQH
jgi:hypothetical protein